MNRINRRDMFRASGAFFIPPFVAAFERKAFAQTAQAALPGAAPDYVPYSADLEAYVAAGLTLVGDRADRSAASRKDWLQAGRLTRLYAEHVRDCGIDSSFKRSLIAVDPTRISATEPGQLNMTQNKFQMRYEELKNGGISGFFWKFAAATRRYSKFPGVPEGSTTDMGSGQSVRLPVYQDAVVHMARARNHDTKYRTDDVQRNAPRFMRVVAPNRGPCKQLTPEECAENAEDLQELEDLLAVLACPLATAGGGYAGGVACGAIIIAIKRLTKKWEKGGCKNPAL